MAVSYHMNSNAVVLIRCCTRICPFANHTTVSQTLADTSPVGINHMQIENPVVLLIVIVGTLKYCPYVTSLTNPVAKPELLANAKFAAELPAHIPDVSVGGVAEAVSAPRGLGALSARKLALSNV